MSHSDDDRGGDDVLEWSVFPFKENLMRSAAVVAVIAAAGTVVYAAFRDPFLAVLAVALLAASLFSYFTRTTYRLGRRGGLTSRDITPTRRESRFRLSRRRQGWSRSVR